MQVYGHDAADNDEAVLYLPALHPTQLPESTAPQVVEYVPAPQMPLAVVKPARIEIQPLNAMGVILMWRAQTLRALVTPVF